jgi:hypothetical protein
MNQEAQEDTTEEQAGKEGHQMMHVSFSQGGELPDDRAYLDGCSTVMAFKNKKFLENLHQVKGGIKINCNAREVTTDVKGEFGGLSVWYLPDGIANIFSMHELEKLYRITYDSWEGFYVVHTPRGEVHFHKPIANALGTNLGDQNNDMIVPTIVADDTNAPNPQSRYPT